jgi:tRNA threonylcarbamoyladenosine biosynthesis protein TsaE
VNAVPRKIESRSIHRRIELPDEAATTALASALATAARPGDVIALAGDLGSGKTTLARGFIAALGVVEEVPSPTFSLVQTYETSRGPVAHFDLYRLARPEDVEELGFDEATADGIVLVEWPERLGQLLPRERLEVRLVVGESPGRRVAELHGTGDWPARLSGSHLCESPDRVGRPDG